ncbi:MAG TPA: glycosyltransferase family 4 protein [Planctomycetota bacterium]|nr:glycosyltransferase family 4 protein [Planctomycetota bacterium]
MNVLVVLEQRYLRTPDGAIWSTSTGASSFWQRYRDVFDSVRVVARVADVTAAKPSWLRADGPGVSFAAVPTYVGPREYLFHRGAVHKAVREAFVPGDAVILRVGSVLADALLPRLSESHYPYAVEVVSDPWDVFSPGAVHHPLRPLFRRWFAHRLRIQCLGARAAAYVTDAALQRRYPPGPGILSCGCSDVDLPREAFVDFSRPQRKPGIPATILTVGTLEQLYKAPDVLIDAVGLAVREGLDLRLVMVGDGRYRPSLEERAERQGLSGKVRFVGWLPAGAAVRRELDQSDLFILPSRQEGLPRAMIEAMARALPCIGSTVGGIPELLPREDLVDPNDARALADMIREVITHPARMEAMSSQNLRKAADYREDVLAARRRSFYREVRDLTRAAAGVAKKPMATPDVIGSGASS